jgi:hypothetical protein
MAGTGFYQRRWLVSLSIHMTLLTQSTPRTFIYTSCDRVIVTFYPQSSTRIQTTQTWVSNTWSYAFLNTSYKLLPLLPPQYRQGAQLQLPRTRFKLLLPLVQHQYKYMTSHRWRVFKYGEPIGWYAEVAPAADVEYNAQGIMKARHTTERRTRWLPSSRLTTACRHTDSTWRSFWNSSPIQTHFKKTVKDIREDNGSNTYGKLPLNKANCNTSDTPRDCI